MDLVIWHNVFQWPQPRPYFMNDLVVKIKTKNNK